ncbi:MAG: carbonic anhydrase family protein [Proteobacteria bacterium]|nr:carbonic anhydrase family protein [Pseudomonadota bacterium]
MTDRLSRRRLLSGSIALAAAVACPLCRPAEADEWGYRGEHGPAHWGHLKPEFNTCSTGKLQTPIDLRAPLSGSRDLIQRDYKPMPLKIVNNGHTIQVNAAPGSSVTIEAERYELLQFHFHHPSEHLLAGKPKSLEAHYVHRNAAGKLAVIGVFYDPGAKPLAAFEPIWAAMPSQEGPEREVPGVTLALDPAFPVKPRHFRYQGSLTTPPCSEGVTWIVYAQPVAISLGQAQAFAKLFPLNARPVQPLNRRTLLVTG